jgi:hypothetical protein
MVKINSSDGNVFEFNEITKEIKKNGIVLSDGIAEPVYTNNENENAVPTFSGIYLKNVGKIVSITGSINTVTQSKEEIY